MRHFTRWLLHCQRIMCSGGRADVLGLDKADRGWFTEAADQSMEAGRGRIKTFMTASIFPKVLYISKVICIQKYTQAA